MDHAERIQRMLERGLVSETQARRLLDSVTSATHAPGGSRPKPRRAIPMGAVTIALFIVFIVLLVLLTGNAPTQEVATVQDVSKTLNQPHATGELGNASVGLISFIALFVLLPLVLVILSYNSLVSAEEKVFSAWAQVESNYQRRADLIPALVETVSRYTRHEADTLQAVTEERGSATDSSAEMIEALVEAQERSAQALGKIGGQPPTDSAQLQRLNTAEQSVGRQLGRLMMVAEQYPELRAADQYMELQAQLEGTENRINVARMRFNDAAQRFNASARKMPTSLIASWGKFQRKAYFQSDEGARDAKPLGFE